MWHKAITRFRLQKISTEQIEEIVFSEYAHLSDAYEKNKKLIPLQNLVEIKYEHLELKTLAVLEKIYNKLHLPNFRSVQKEFIAQVEKERKYQKFKYAYSEAIFQKIESRWSEYIHRWKEKMPEETGIEYSV